jgi:hypothetical protein
LQNKIQLQFLFNATSEYRLTSYLKKLCRRKKFLIDLNDAQDITNLSGDFPSKSNSKALTVDLRAALVAAGITSQDIPEKIESGTMSANVLLNNVNLNTLLILPNNHFQYTQQQTLLNFGNDH